MTRETHRSHPDEEALIARLDEPAHADTDVARHLARCEACAERVAGLREVLDALADEPALPDAATLAARRERIQDAIGSGRDAAARRLHVRPVAWIPLLAAAALAAVLLWNPGRDEPPAPPTGGVVAEVPSAADAPEDPVAAEAERTAEALVSAAAPPTGESDELDDVAVESLAEIETTTPSLTDESEYESTLLVDRFAALSAEDQDAILDELSDLTFEL